MTRTVVRSARWLVAVSTSLALTTSPCAFAGEADISPENRAMAETLFFTARGMFDAGRTKEACLKFAESYRLDPAAGTLLNLAVCHEKEGKIASAWGEFKLALADAKKANREDRAALAQEHIVVIEPELPRLTIEVDPKLTVPGLEISRNGTPLLQAAWNTELPVDPGVVVVVVKAPGYKPHEQKIEIEKKQQKTLKITALEKAPVVAPPPAATERVWSAEKKWGLTSIIVGTVLVGGGAALGAMTLDAKKKSDQGCELYDGERRCTQAGVDSMAEARTYSLLSTGGFALGAIGIGLGSYLLFTGKDVERPKTAWTLAPTVGGAQFALTTRF